MWTFMRSFLVVLPVVVGIWFLLTQHEMQKDEDNDD